MRRAFRAKASGVRGDGANSVQSFRPVVGMRNVSRGKKPSVTFMKDIEENRGAKPCPLCGKELPVRKVNKGRLLIEFHYAPCGMPCAGQKLTKTAVDAYWAAGGSHTIVYCHTCGPMPTPHNADLRTPEKLKRTKAAYRYFFAMNNGDFTVRKKW